MPRTRVSAVPRRSLTTITFMVLALSLSGCSSITGLGWLGGSSSAIAYNDTAWCVPRKLKKVLNRVAERYGKVTVHSTKRWWLENWWKGGARHSLHLDCRAVDFSVGGNPSSVVAFLKAQPEVGGYKYYRGGHYHIDNGSRRTW